MKKERSALRATGVIRGISHTSIQYITGGRFFSCCRSISSRRLLCACERSSIRWPVKAQRVWVGAECVFAAWQGLQPLLVRQTRQNWVLHIGCGLDSHKAPSGLAPKERACVCVCVEMDGWMYRGQQSGSRVSQRSWGCSRGKADGSMGGGDPWMWKIWVIIS